MILCLVILICCSLTVYADDPAPDLTPGQMRCLEMQPKIKCCENATNFYTDLSVSRLLAIVHAAQLLLLQACKNNPCCRDNFKAAYNSCDISEAIKDTGKI